MNMKINYRGLITAFVISTTAPVFAISMECEPKDSCFEAEKWQGIQGQLPSHSKRNISNKQQKILFELMKHQSKDRQEIRMTAHLALKNLQRLAVSESYDQFAAKELALIYGHALADLAYLDIQLAVRFRSVLTEYQLKALQEKNDFSQ
jgi:Spy/CpxP family protein refolding chaperone